MKKNPIFLVATVIMIIVVLGSTVALFVTHRKFATAALELAQIKEEYEELVAVLKRSLRDAPNDELSNDDEKKKVEPEFVTVNREPSYLRESAVAFARKHHVEPAVSQLYYGSHESSLQAGRRSRAVRTTMRSRLRSRRGRSGNRWDYTNEPLERDGIFQWPITRDSFWLSSPYGPRRRPDGSSGFHTGIDMAAVRGTPVHVPLGGVVIQAGYLPGYGNSVLVKHNAMFKTRYAHLAKIKVAVGDTLHVGQVLGTVGATGTIRSRTGDGSHLHFEVYRFGRHVNPMYFLV